MPTIGSSIIGSSGGSGPTDTSIAAELIEKKLIPVANTEVTHVLPATTKQYKIRNTGNALVKLAFTALASGTTFWPIYPDESFCTTNIQGTATITLYMQSPGTSQSVAIWSGQ